MLGMMLGDSNAGGMELNPPVLPSVEGHAARVRLPFIMGNLAWKLSVAGLTQPQPDEGVWFQVHRKAALFSELGRKRPLRFAVGMQRTPDAEPLIGPRLARHPVRLEGDRRALEDNGLLVDRESLRSSLARLTDWEDRAACGVANFAIAQCWQCWLLS